MSKRIIMRIELTPPAKEALQGFADHAGMTQFAITSRLVEWFALQPETIQSAVLRRYPSEIETDVAKLLLRRIAEQPKRSPETPEKPADKSTKRELAGAGAR